MGEQVASSKQIIRVFIFLLVVTFLNLVGWRYTQNGAVYLLPVYQWALTALTDHYAVQSMQLLTENDEWVIKAVVTTQQHRVLFGQVIPDGAQISCSTLAGQALQPIIIAVSILLVWPVRKIWHRLLLLSLCIPILFLFTALDTPIVLLGALEDLILFNLDPTATKFSIPIQAMNILNGGGRQGLGLLAALLSIGIYRYWVLRPLDLHHA